MNRTVIRSLTILDLVSKRREGITLKEITNELDIPKSSAFDIVQTLLCEKLIETNKYNDKMYVLGSKAFSIGIKYITQKNLLNVSRIYLDKLCDDLAMTGFVAEIDETEIIYLYKHEGISNKLASAHIGSRGPVYYTSLGKAILANYPSDKQDVILNKIEYIPMTKQTRTSKEELKADLDEIKARGYSIDDRESEEYRICFGAPIYDKFGNVIAAVSVSDLYDKSKKYNNIGEKIKNTASKITEELSKIQ